MNAQLATLDLFDTGELNEVYRPKQSDDSQIAFAYLDGTNTALEHLFSNSSQCSIVVEGHLFKGSCNSRSTVASLTGTEYIYKMQLAFGRQLFADGELSTIIKDINSRVKSRKSE